MLTIVLACQMVTHLMPRFRRLLTFTTNTLRAQALRARKTKLMEKRLRLSVLSLQGLLEFRLIEIEASGGVSPSLGVDLYQWIRITKSCSCLSSLPTLRADSKRAEKPAFSPFTFSRSVRSEGSQAGTKRSVSYFILWTLSLYQSLGKFVS